MDLPSLNVLIIEDEPGHAVAIQRAFTHARAQDTVRTVGSLTEGRDAIAAAAPDVVVTDMQLPDGKAFELLNSPDIGENFPVIVMTSYGDETVAVEAMKAGAVDYVVKSPAAFNEMPRTVERVMREWAHVQEVQKARDALAHSQAELRSVFDGTPVMLCLIDSDRRVLISNRAFHDFVSGVSQDVPQERPCGIMGCVRALDDPAGCGCGLRCGECALRAAMVDTLCTGKPHIDVECELPIRRNGVEQTVVFLGSITPMPPENGCVRALVSLLDITDRKRLEADLKRIEWMLTTPFESVVGDAQQKVDYGDLTKLNQNGLILKSVGRDMLAKITSDFLDLLGTSSAIYEANGDYAHGIFASGWCRMMDCASRELCATSDNARALASGCWICHESCWNSCAKEAMACGETVDVECAGGIRLFGIPMFVNGEVIGIINFGYGDPPKDPQKLKELARTFKVDYETLRSAAEEYQTRPPYIIEMAKRRLRSSAQTIELLVARRQVEDALRKSEEKISSIMNAIDDAIISFSAEDGAINYCSPSCIKFFGGSVEEEFKADSNGWISHIHPDDICVVYESALKLRDQGAVEAECRLVGPDGSIIWVLVRQKIVYDPQTGRSKRFDLMLTDITERKHLEFEVRTNEERLRLAHKAVNDVVWDWDVVKDAQRWNEAGTDVFGWTESVVNSVSGHWWLERVHPEDANRVGDGFFAVLNDPAADYWHDDYRFRKADGSYAEVMDRGYVLRDNDGGALRMVGAMMDITERKLAEQKLIESEALLARSQQVAHIGSWQVHVSTKQLLWSNELYRIFGLAQQEHAADYDLFREIVHPDDLARGEAAYDDFFRGDCDTFEFEHRIIRKDTGEIRHICQRCVNERDADGTVIRSIGMVQDITERKQVEEKAAEHLRELEQWYRVTLNREDRVLELKAEVNTLLERLGEERKYGKDEL